MELIGFLLKIIIPAFLVTYLIKTYKDQIRTPADETGESGEPATPPPPRKSILKTISSIRLPQFLNWIPGAMSATTRALWPRGVILAAFLTALKYIANVSNGKIKEILNIGYNYDTFSDHVQAFRDHITACKEHLSSCDNYWSVTISNINWAQYRINVSQIFFSDAVYNRTFVYTASAVTLLLAIFAFVMYSKSKNEEYTPYSWVPLFTAIALIAGFAVGLHSDYLQHIARSAQQSSINPILTLPNIVVDILIQTLTLACSLYAGQRLLDKEPLSWDSFARNFSLSWLPLLMYNMSLTLIGMVLFFLNTYFPGIDHSLAAMTLSQNITLATLLIVSLTLLFVPYYAYFKRMPFPRALGSSVKFILNRPLQFLAMVALLSVLYLVPFMLDSILSGLPASYALGFNYWLTPFISTLWKAFVVVFLLHFFRTLVAPAITPELDELKRNIVDKNPEAQMRT